MAINRAKTLAKAEKLLKKNQIDAAIEEFKLLLKDNPQDRTILSRIGDLCARQKRTSDAIEYFNRLASLLAQDGFFMKAIAIYRRVTKLDPNNLEVHEKLADLFLQQSLTGEARQSLEIVGNHYMSVSQHDKAAQIYQKIVTMDPDNLKARSVLGELYHKGGDTEKGVQEFLHIGNELIRMGKVKESAVVFEKALQMSPGNVDLLRGIVEGHLANGAPDKASDLLSAMIDKHPNRAEFQLLLVDVQVQQGDTNKGIEILEGLLDKHRDNRALREKMFLLKIRNKDNDGAFEAIEPVVRAKFEGGDTQGCKSYLQVILKQNPNHLKSLHWQVDLARQDKDESAQIEALQALVDALIHNEDFNKAQPYAETLLELEPDNLQAQSKLDFILEKLGRKTSSDAIEMEAEPEVEAEPVAMEMEEAFSVDESAAADTEVEAEVEADIEVEAEEEIEIEDEIEVEADEAELDIEIDADMDDEVVVEADEDDLEVEAPAAEVADIDVEDEEIEVAAEPELDIAVDDEGEAAAAAPAAEAGAGDEEWRAQYTEVDIFLKYGLTDKAVDLLEQLARDYNEPAEIMAKLEEVRAAEAAPEADISVEEDDVPVPDIEVAEEPAEEAAPEPEPEPAAEEKPKKKSKKKKKKSKSALAELEALSLSVKPKKSKAKAAAEPEEVEPPAAPEPVAEDVPEPVIDEVAIPDVDDVAVDDVAEDLEVTLDTPAKDESAEKIQMVEFYLDQDLVEEADKALQTFKKEYPDHDKLAGLEERLAAKRAPKEDAPAEEPAAAAASSEGSVKVKFKTGGEEPEPAESLLGGDEDFADLAAELNSALDGLGLDEDEDLFGGEPEKSAEEMSLEDIFSEFKKGIDEQVDAEDFETHYNLGIAYQEMGLLDEAIAEFQYSSKSPKYFIDCCSMLANAFRDQGNSDAAMIWLEKAVASDLFSIDVHMGLKYDLADLKESADQKDEALQLFSDIYALNAAFRDVSDRMKALKG